MESYKNITINSVSVHEFSAASLIYMKGIPYLSKYTFSGIYANNVILGEVNLFYYFDRVCINTQK